MAWITPVTDRGLRSMTTATDMNRISGNLNYLTGITFKTDYTNADIVKADEFNKIISTAKYIASSFGLTVTNLWRFDNLNTMEMAMKLMHEHETNLPGDTLYPSEDLLP